MTSRWIRSTHWINYANAQGYQIPEKVTARYLREAITNGRLPGEMIGAAWCFDEAHTDHIAKEIGATRSVTTQHAA